MASIVYTKEYIQGHELLNREWDVGDDIVYNSEPEDFGRQYLHLHYGTIIAIHDKATHCRDCMIHIRLPYGKIIIPLHKITLQFKPKHRNAVNCSHRKRRNHINCTMDDDDDEKAQTVQRFFVMGTLRDDIENAFSCTKEWAADCRAESGRLYRFKLYKERYEDYPFAVKTGSSTDYVNGRIISWPHAQHTFVEKLRIADKMNAFMADGSHAIEESLYQRDIVDVMNANGDMVPAITYYKNVCVEELLGMDEIPDGDWSKRDRSRDLSEYNPSVALLAMIRNAIQRSKESFNDELVDSLPLPPEHEEDMEYSDDTDNETDSKCASVIHGNEYFRISGNTIAIINGCRTVKKFRRCIHTAYGKYVIHSDGDCNIYKWRFQINHVGAGGHRTEVDDDDGVLVIGIASKVNETMYLNDAFYQYDELDNYSANVCNGYRITQNMFEQYAMRAKSGDIIEMELNMDHATLSYFVNGAFQGIAFDDILKDKHTSYQMAVSLQNEEDELSLLDFSIGFAAGSQ